MGKKIRNQNPGTNVFFFFQKHSKNIIKKKTQNEVYIFEYFFEIALYFIYLFEGIMKSTQFNFLSETFSSH